MLRFIWNSRLGTPERTPGEHRGERDQATKTAQPRGANRSHQKEKTNGSTNGCNREAQTPGSPAGDSQKTERRGAKEEAKPTQKEQKKSESTEPKQRTPERTPGERRGSRDQKGHSSQSSMREISSQLWWGPSSTRTYSFGAQQSVLSMIS